MASSVPHAVATRWCYIEQKIEKVSYMWTINNFKFCFNETNANLYSPVFPGSYSKTLWQLRIQKSNYLYIYLLLKSAPEKQAIAKYKCSVVNGKQEKHIHDSQSLSLIKESNYSSSECKLQPSFVFTDLTQCKVTIFCEIFVIGDCVNNSGQINTEVAEFKLSKAYSKLLHDEKFTDVTLVVDGHEIRAHKAILATRSAVFAAMFEHDFEERKSNCVDITDIQPEVLREILKFIYTGKAPNIKKLVKDLLVAADKYALEKLKLMCENELSVNLSVETAAETLILADRHSAKQLKVITLAFINSHVIAVMQTPDWQKCIETHAYLIAEAFQAFAVHQCSKIEPTTNKT